jgi:hypothetical protein
MSGADCRAIHPDDTYGFEGSDVVRTCDFKVGHEGPHRTTWTTEDGNAFQDEWSEEGPPRSVFHHEPERGKPELAQGGS